MKRRLLALVFVLAFALSSFAALGVSSVSADGPTLTIIAAGITVEGPAQSTGGAVTAFTAITDAGVEIENIDVSFVC